MPDGRYHGVVQACVCLRRYRMLVLRLVENLPVIDLVMMAGVVTVAQFVGESSMCVPAHQPGVVIADFLHAGIAQLRPLFVTPVDFIGIAWRIDRFVGAEHPLRNRAEIQHHRMTVGGVQKIQNEWIDQRKIPERVIGRGWRQLCNP